LAKRKRSAAPADASPGLAEREEEVMRWISVAIQEGVSQNRAEHSYEHIGEAIDAIMGIDEPRVRSPRLSRARFNKLQKIALELRALLTDIKPFWNYSANAERYQRQADIFGKLSKSWFLRRGIDQVFRDAIDYVLVAGTGYIHMFFNPDIPGPTDKDTGLTMQGDIDAIAEDPRDVGMIRFQGGDKRTMQNARGAWVRRERPLDYFERIYGAEASAKIQKDRDGFEKESPTQRRLRETEEAVMSEGTPAQGALFGGAPANSIGGKIPVADEFTVYLHDWSINNSKDAKEMGPWSDDPDEPGQRIPASPWSYIAEPGAPLYPFGRRIIATRYGILEDGPGHFHHGMLPICKVTLDTWAWSRWGTSPIHPLISLQRDVNEDLRAIQDHIRRSSKRNFIYDKKAISPTLAKGFDTRLSGMQLGINPHAAGPKGAFQIVDEPPLDAAIPEHLKFLLDSMDELSGVANLRGLAELNQIPSSDTIEQLIQAMTPLVRTRSRSLEIFIRDFAAMLMSMFMQFYPLELRLRLLGADGMTYEDWDYKQGDLMPDFIRDEDYEFIDADAPNGGRQKIARVKQSAWARGPDPEHVRNKEFMRYFNFDVAEGTLLDVATTSRRMFYLQGARMGLVDHWTLLEQWGVPNVGKPPSWATDITSRLQAERILGLGIMASTAGRPPTAQSTPAFSSTGAISESKGT
jgi:hypothetical protein